VSGARDVAPDVSQGFPVARLRRDEFPWMDSGESVYLNAASTGPLPERCVRAQDAFTRRRAAPYRLSQDDQFDVLADSRQHIARLIGADVAEIALAVNTGAGLNLAAWALPLGPRDVVVIPDLEFPANVYPWMAAAAARGFTLTRVPCRDGLMDEPALLAALDEPGVRVLAVSWLGFPPASWPIWTRSARLVARAASTSWWTPSRDSAR
jgi:selenocysteine lyase/cysteine desulfurase